MVLTEHPIVSEAHKMTMELSTTVGVALESLGVTSLSFTLDFAAKSLFGQGVSTTQFLVFITHNSKMVGPIAKRLFGQTITLFP